MRKSSAFEANELRRILSAVLMLCMSKDSFSEAQFQRLVKSARRDARARLDELQLGRFDSIDTVLLGSVLHRWHRDPNYLNSDAKPVPIKESGPAPSVQALFRDEKSVKSFRTGLAYMRRQGIVRRTRSGLIIPNTDTVIIHSLTPELVANVSMAIDRLVKTLFQNTSMSKRGEVRLIERNAVVVDLPRKRASEFKSFSREQGAALISTINDWLENRRVNPRRTSRANKTKTVTAGIHLFAFCEEN